VLITITLHTHYAIHTRLRLLSSRSERSKILNSPLNLSSSTLIHPIHLASSFVLIVASHVPIIVHVTFVISHFIPFLTKHHPNSSRCQSHPERSLLPPHDVLRHTPLDLVPLSPDAVYISWTIPTSMIYHSLPLFP
jgi:hypothetical protein